MKRNIYKKDKGRMTRNKMRGGQEDGEDDKGVVVAMTSEKMINRGRMYDQKKEIKKGKRLELQKRIWKDYYWMNGNQEKK